MQIRLDIHIQTTGELLDALFGANASGDRKVTDLFKSGANPDLALNDQGLRPIHAAVLQRNIELLRGPTGQPLWR